MSIFVPIVNARLMSLRLFSGDDEEENAGCQDNAEPPPE